MPGAMRESVERGPDRHAEHDAMKTPGTSRRAPPPRRFARAGEAVSALEYAILVGVISVGVGAAVVTVGGDITTALNAIGDDIAKVKTTKGKAIN
jgi:Flp pilus assembly pilin Flp